MRTETVSTKAADHEYEVTYQVFESLDEARGFWSDQGENPDEVLLGILNASQAQNAKQNGKEEVRKALKTGDEEALQAAVAAHQKGALEYLIGAPRSTGPIKKKDATVMGTELAKKAAQAGGVDELDEDEMREILKQFIS